MKNPAPRREVEEGCNRGKQRTGSRGPVIRRLRLVVTQVGLSERQDTIGSVKSGRHPVGYKRRGLWTESDMSSQDTQVVARIGEPLGAAAEGLNWNERRAISAVIRRKQNTTSPPNGIETNE